MKQLESIRSLAKAYEQAVKSNKEYFIFNNEKYSVKFAAFLIVCSSVEQCESD